MNPLPLLLLALTFKGGSPILGTARTMEFTPSGSLSLDSLITTLQGATHTLEQINQLSHMGNTMGRTFHQLTEPAAQTTPATPSQEVFESISEPSTTSSLLDHIDLQSAMQSLGPLLSLLNQSGK